MKNTKTNIEYFQVKDFAKTEQKHHAKIVKLSDSYELAYDDVLDNSAWSDIETMTYQKIELWKSMGMEIKKKTVASLINGFTRQVISNSLEYNEVPKSYDTAFYIMHYMKVREGMADILQNFEDRRDL